MLLKDCTTIYNGSTPSTNNTDFWDGNIVWITPKDLSNYSKRYFSRGERNIAKLGYNNCSTKLLPKNTILLTSKAPIGYIAISSNKICTNQGFKSIVYNDNVIPLFLYYWLINQVKYLKFISGGATFKELSKENLENVEIDLPSLSTQQHIVDSIANMLYHYTYSLFHPVYAHLLYSQKI